jgi:hypothetical protein
MMYFLNFNTTFNIGFEYSSHNAYIDTYVRASANQLIGRIQTNLIRPFIGVRYYLDTSDLGTAITYSNPYLTGRLSYWYQTNEFPESDVIENQSGGGIGTAIGFGLEFPIELKETYFNIEFLYHFVQFFDEFTTQLGRWQPGERSCSDVGLPDGCSEADIQNARPSNYGYDNLFGDAITVVGTINFNW